VIVHSYVKLPKGGKSTKKEVALSHQEMKDRWHHWLCGATFFEQDIYWSPLVRNIDQHIGQVGLMKQELDWMKLEHHQPTVLEH
jgi:glutathione S-transferase